MTDFLGALFPGALQTDIFAGGLALGLFWAVLGLLHRLALRLRRLVQRRFLAEVTLDNRAAAYRQLYAWIEAKGVLAHVRQLRLTDVKGTEGELYGPAPGTHWFWYRGRPCRFERELNERARVGDRHEQKPMETVSLTLPFGRVETIKAWIDEGATILADRARRGPELHVARGDWWQPMGALPGRGLDSVLCDDDRLIRMADDLRRFLGARDWYAQRGIPWRRGYLLYGPPGTGKSSVLRALATDLHLDLALIDLCRPGLTDDDLRELMFCAPHRAIIAMEDVDAAFRGRKPGERGSLSFSGLLNAIDGVAAQEGRALVMTTNHRDRLDPALIRPGRADVQVEVGTIGAAAAAGLYLRFFPGEAGGAAQFADRIGAHRLTGAEVQGWLLAHAADPGAAAAWRATPVEKALPLPRAGKGKRVGGIGGMADALPPPQAAPLPGATDPAFVGSPESPAGRMSVPADAA